MEQLKGKVALITGASKGIGQATAEYLASLGVSVVLAARSGGAVADNAKTIAEGGGNALGITCDVANYNDVVSTIEATVNTFGRLDILVNNAGLIDPITHLGDSDPAAWNQVIDVNVKGVYHGIHAALPVFQKQGAGTIVNISSGAATNAIEGWSHYCTSKAAVLMLTRMVHKEYGDKGVRVIGLSPGTVATDMQRSIKQSGINPVSKLDWEDHIKPDWPAKAIAYLCTDAADDLLGEDFSLKTEAGRKRVGLL